MIQLPPKMVFQLSPVKISIIEKWWANLDVSKQEELEQLYQLEEEKNIEISLCAKNVEEPIEPSEKEVWVEDIHDLYEYFVNHEVSIYQHEVYGRSIVCSQHPTAQKIVQTGLLPKKFQCPLENKECPMLHISKQLGNNEVQFFIQFKAL